MSQSVTAFLGEVAKRNANEPEFMQAVKEVAETVIPFIEENPKYQGKMLLERIIALAKENQSDRISLNVNRFNKACAFYQKMGFEIVAQEDLEIGNGYLMEDYKMEKKI